MKRNRRQCDDQVLRAGPVPRALIALLGIAFLASGCQMPHVKQPVDRQFGGSDVDAQLDFWHTLNDQLVASNDDAFHGLLLYLDSQDNMPDYPSRVAELKRRGLLPAYFNGPADEAVSRGIVAYAAVRMLKIKGGWMMSLFGTSERYAVRELMFRNVFPPSSPEQTFSGTEFVGIIGRIEDYQRGNPAQRPAGELPGE